MCLHCLIPYTKTPPANKDKQLYGLLTHFYSKPTKQLSPTNYAQPNPVEVKLVSCVKVQLTPK